jgi:ABC-type glycerol-3-phosphate transport system permease component
MMGLQAGAQVHRKRKREWRHVFARWSWRGVVYTVAVLIAIASLMPFIWTISTSLKQGKDVLSIPPKLIPNKIFWQNYTAVFDGFGGYLPFGKWLRNSIFLSGANIFGEILFASIAAFGFTRFRFPGRNLMFLAMVSSAIIPGMVRMLPQYMMFADWGWTNTYLPLIIPNWFGGMFLTFLFRQYFVTIPRSLDEAALVDGASSLDIFFRIVLPLSKPMISTAAILIYMFNWNSFLEPFIYLHEIDKYPLAVGLQYMRNFAYTGVTKEPLMAAYSLIMAGPVIMVFFFFQRHFVQGIQLSASKE